MTSEAPVRDAPGPSGLPLLGSLGAIVRDPLTFFLRLREEHGDVAEARLGPFRIVLVSAPEGVKHVLVDHHRNYVKSRSYDGLKLILGRGLLTSEGDFWMRQRRLAQPAFHRERLAGFVRQMGDATAAMIARWEGEGHGTSFDLHSEMLRVTLRIAGLTLFSVDVDADSATVYGALAVVVPFADAYGVSPVRTPLWLPTTTNRRFRRALRDLDLLVTRIVDERREGVGARDGPEGSDVLDMLMAARDEDSGEGMNARQLRDEVMTLLLAGHETTATNLTWTFLLLARHPEIARRLHEEAVSVLGDELPTADRLGRMPLLSMVIHESMRLYPPVWVFEREAVAPDSVCGYRVRKGAIVAVSPWVLHRHPSHWDRPEEFDPERFRPEAVAARARHTYLPFAAGPRQCIGNTFALLEAQVVLSMLVRRYRFDLVPGHSVEPEPLITLRPRHGMMMTRARW